MSFIAIKNSFPMKKLFFALDTVKQFSYQKKVVLFLLYNLLVIPYCPQW